MRLTDYSFLDDGKNTNLIRWSDDGNSFVVEDEDEFAKKLIPELFKHNNYASFVRQLNMYGFHKKVGLSDNSMRASEKKSKSPSEYSNPYFRRGHPDLLWLIQKPRNVTAGQSGRIRTPVSKKPDFDLNEDENDDYIEEIQPAQQQQQQQSQQPKTKPQGRLAIGQGDSTLPSEQLVNVHRELHAIRAQQAQIAAMIHRLKREHEQLYGQAANFQDQHSRHENSINAILTFLATVYNRSLQGHEGVQGIANLFTGSIPPDSNQSHVVDVGDYTFDQLNGADGSIQRSFKRQPLLLKAPPIEEGRASTGSSLTGGGLSEGRQTRRMSPAVRNGVNQLGDVEELLDMRNHRQPQPQPQPQTQPHTAQRANQSSHQNQGDILSVIQNTNARNSTPGTPASDFSNVLNSLETSGGGSPLTSSQRADMLRLIHNQGSASNTGDNALTSPNPPPMPKNFDRQLAATKSDLDFLAKMQADQDRSVQNLTNLLQPLSPTGSIPGLGDGGDVQPPPLDIEDFLNNTANYLSDFPSDHNFDFNGTDLDNQTTSTNGINFANLADGDDELFGNIGSNNHNNNNNHTTNNNVSSQTLPTNTNTNINYDYLNIDGTTSDGGRVESMASSEGASPTNTIDTIDGDGGVDGPPASTRSRVFDPQQQQQQYQRVENPVRKRKRMS